MSVYLSDLPQEYIDIESMKGLSNEELCLLYQQGLDEALSELAIQNTKLLYSRAYKYLKRTNHKLEIEDLVQWGFIGMLKAAQKFDYSLGNKFTTYAVWWIDQSISRAIIDEGYTIRLPVHIFEKVERVHSIVRINETVEGDQIIDLINEDLNLEKDTIKDLLQLHSFILNMGSLYSPVGEDGDSFIMDFICYEELDNVELEVEKLALKEEIKNLLTILNPREQDIIEMRYGLNGNAPHTLEEIGEKYQLTRERIRQIQERALRKLKKPTHGKELREFL